MKRKNYQAPQIKTHQVALVKMLCTSVVESMQSNASLNYGGAGKVDARSRGTDSFDEWDEE